LYLFIIVYDCAGARISSRIPLSAQVYKINKINSAVFLTFLRLRSVMSRTSGLPLTGRSYISIMLPVGGLSFEEDRLISMRNPAPALYITYAVLRLQI